MRIYKARNENAVVKFSAFGLRTVQLADFRNGAVVRKANEALPYRLSGVGDEVMGGDFSHG